MSIDLSKLSPAPWRAVTCSDKSCWHIQCREWFYGMPEDDCKFIALARAAFEVMMRRGWVLQSRLVDEGVPARYREWYVIDPETDMPPHNSPAEPWSDPFTALVEADKWYTENIEKEGQK